MKHLTDANKGKLLAFLRSRAAAGEASLKSWGRDQRPQIPGVLVEEIADALVAEGKATRETKVHGGRVWRAAVEPIEKKHLDLSIEEPDVEEEPEEEPVAVAGDVEPAPLPTSDAPPEEPAAVIDAAAMVEEALPLEEPIMPAGAAEPCEECEYLRLQLNAPCQECERLRQERDMAQGEAHGLRHHLHEVNAERDELREQLAASAAAVADAGRQYTYLLDAWQRLCHLLDVDSGRLDPALDRVRLLVAGAQASAGRPGVDGPTLADYLIRLTDERWLVVQQGRAQLAEARELRRRAAEMEAKGHRTLESLLDTPTGAPAPELVPDPIPLGESVPAPPPSGEQSSAPREPDRSSVVGKALAWLRKREQGTPGDLAAALKIAKPHANTTLVTLTNRGLAERIAQGVYRAREQGREAAE